MSKHTPGPWEHQGAMAGIVEVDGFDPLPVECIGTSTSGIAFIPSDGDARDRANARLIAAAPEMLEACKDLSEQVAAYELIHGPNSSAICPDAIRAAIAKATA